MHSIANHGIQTSGCIPLQPSDKNCFQETLVKITQGLKLAASIGKQNVLLLGVFNARHVTLDEKNYSNGEKLEEFMRTNTLNNEQPTFLCVGGSKK